MSPSSKYQHPTTLGYMPLKSSYGFLTPQATTRDAAHELGHGKFNLRHTFSQHNVVYLPEGSTQNLMDYSTGSELLKYQWDFIHNPEGGWYLWEDSEEGAALGSNDHYIEINGTLYEGYTKEELNTGANIKTIRIYYFPGEEPVNIKARAGVLNKHGELIRTKNSKWKHEDGDEIEKIDKDYIEFSQGNQMVIMHTWCSDSYSSFFIVVEFIPIMPNLLYNSAPQDTEKIGLNVDPIGREHTFVGKVSAEFLLDFLVYEAFQTLQEHPNATFFGESKVSDCGFIESVEWNEELRTVDSNNPWGDPYALENEENILTVKPKIGEPVSYKIIKRASVGCKPISSVRFDFVPFYDYGFDNNFDCSQSTVEYCESLFGNSKPYPSYKTPMGDGVPWLTIRDDEIKNLKLVVEPKDACKDLYLSGNANVILNGDNYESLSISGSQFPEQKNYFVEARRGSDSTVVGKLNVLALKKPEKPIVYNVKIVQVKLPSASTYPSYGHGWETVEKDINEILKPLYQSVTLNTSNIQQLTLNYDVNGDGMLDKSEREYIANAVTKELDTYYVFVVGCKMIGVKETLITGAAIGNENYSEFNTEPFAWVTTQSSQAHITIAHELGHSIFGLKDVQLEFGELTDPFNIMNYGRSTGAKLKVYQILHILGIKLNNLEQWTEN